MGQGFLHVNGTTYELAYTPSDLTTLRERMKAGSTPQAVDVRIDGRSVSLEVDPQRVATLAVWAVEDAPA